MNKIKPTLTNLQLKHCTIEEIEDYIHDESEKEHYRELAEEAAWIGGE